MGVGGGGRSGQASKRGMGGGGDASRKEDVARLHIM